jgi:hypothetical protein
MLSNLGPKLSQGRISSARSRVALIMLVPTGCQRNMAVTEKMDHTQLAWTMQSVATSDVLNMKKLSNSIGSLIGDKLEGQRLLEIL